MIMQDSSMIIESISDVTLAPWQYQVRVLDARSRNPRVRLSAHPDLGQYAILDEVGDQVGILLGFPIDLKTRRIIRESLRIDTQGQSDTSAVVEGIRDRLGGIYLLVIKSATSARIYPDCAAQVPCVFSSTRRKAAGAASSLLSPEDYELALCRELFLQLDVTNDGWFPGGLTAHSGIERLLPNHYLDLSNWKQVRHWPLHDIQPSSSPDDNIDELIEIIRAQLEALVSGPQAVVQALTAGRDTRLLLACARPYLDSMELVTIEAESAYAIDTILSKRLARDLGLRHRILPRSIADSDAAEDYLRRGGHCVGGANRLLHPSMNALRDHVFVGGMHGEYGRAYLWRRFDQRHSDISGELIRTRFGLPAVDVVTERLNQWVGELTEFNAFTKLDLAYLEHRMGPWSSAQFFCDPTLVRHNPIGTTRTIKLMFGLPEDWKRNRCMDDRVIGKLWPELLAYRFNSQGPAFDFFSLVGRAARRPSLIVRKLRKLRR